MHKPKKHRQDSFLFCRENSLLFEIGVNLLGYVGALVEHQMKISSMHQVCSSSKSSSLSYQFGFSSLILSNSSFIFVGCPAKESIQIPFFYQLKKNCNIGSDGILILKIMYCNDVP